MSSKEGHKGLLFVMSAPSGAGKTSICSAVLERLPGLRHSISYATRTMRAGEQDGVDYHFVSMETFKEMVAAGEFVEWAEVHGNCYGTARKPIEEASSLGIDILLDIDVQGAAQLRASGLDGVYIFILPPNLAELRRRLVGRNSDSEAIIARRLDNAAGEIAEAGHFDYLVVNSDLEQAVGTVQAIMQAEKHRTVRAIGGLPVEFGLK
ncbi:MAG: guanylate kinase [Desulfuromonas sp.]|nr:MAG: guanylate kinase [Desulfuromonas sp.]